ncbi:hypothetical protein PF005_g27937 [Phytophthora fragariae]|uniref:Uncharacterized protein n=1 Tax=Phytophthora fragariae TaxID=53985 RepID=A0A6A4DUS7_9STRA|nr:hypothetical protein PF003_g32871 [Phytophthora fragariae]KAE8923570.1 hypothetical protein PF009_g26182 [Phytophthora fragariae]KAE8972682.1 hypothetical protein PF011_g25547 [Phytophthora fragariae]KAE9084951.1 hypothetical protein PF006_g26363 [Phytophthora fragariae]KAE9115949.1 hypothetical protein PF010_g9134 [Phytophthora fragariae]
MPTRHGIAKPPVFVGKEDGLFFVEQVISIANLATPVVRSFLNCQNIEQVKMMSKSKAFTYDFPSDTAAEELAVHERRYFALELARVLLVSVVPSCIIFCRGNDRIPGGAGAGGGLQMRSVYWTEEDQYKLKILSYYIRKIDIVFDHFPSSLSANKIKLHYCKLTWPLLLLFVPAYAALVVFRYAKLHRVELPQVLALRAQPEFATDGLANAAESTPFAHAVSSYNAAGSGHVVEVNVQKSVIEI